MAVQAQIDLLLQGERIQGTYQLQIARQNATGWATTIPPLHALVTNYRMILWPQTRRTYPPASIPRNYIIHVGSVPLDHRNGVRIRLKTGHEVNVIVAFSEGGPLAEAVQKMLTPPLRGRGYSAKLTKQDLQRLIEIIDGI
jgi:hypothetical protein